MTARKPLARTTSRTPLLIVTGILVALLALMIIFQPPSYTRGLPGDPENPEPQGSMALAEVLRTHGTDVKVVRSVSSALASAPDLLVVTKVDALAPHQVRALAEQGVDTVFIGATRDIPGFLTDLTREGASTGITPPGCADPLAAAGPIRTTGPALSAPGAEACFPGPDSGAMLTWETQQGARASILPGDVLVNDHLLEESNAALALRVLGQAPQVTWLVGTSTDPYGVEGAGADFALDWLWILIGVMLAAAIWWRGPRFGALTSEPLPVIVNASETTIGRGHLYRRAGDLEHAAASLRLGALHRIGPRIGLSPNATPAEVITQVARASGRSESQVRTLLYGPPPDGSRSLQALALSLDALEDEVEHL